MREHSFLKSMITGGVALGALGLFALPVIEDMNDGQVSALVGNAAASAAMIYVLLTPILLTIANSLPARLIAIGVATGAATVVRTWVDLVEAEDLGLALIVTVASIAALAALALTIRVVSQSRRARVSGMAWIMARAASQVTEHLRRRYGGSPENGRADGPLQQVLLVENLVFSLLTQAETSDTAEEFAAVVVAGLAEMREGLAAARHTDRGGYGAIAAAEYCGRLTADLRRLVPGIAAVPSRSRGAARPA
ncbi:MAG: hypothetical protein WCZ23_10335 [Rhodospirillaceae bacterium]